MSQDHVTRSNKNLVIHKPDGFKSTHPVIQRKTAVLNKENLPQNKTTGGVTKTTVRPHVLGAHQGQNVGSVSVQFQRDRKSNPTSKQRSSVTKTDANREDVGKGNDCVAENSFDVWFIERREHWEQDHQRECVELGEFELLERAADEISFSSNSSFINTLLHRDRRRLSSTPIKSSNQSTPQGVGEACGLGVGHTAPVPPANNGILKDAEMREDKESDAQDKELQAPPIMSDPPIRHCFQVPTLPYDKRTYQDRDGASSPEGDERSSVNNEDSTLIDSRGQLEFDDDDTWNDPEDESSCPVEESPSERMLKRKVAFSKGAKPVSVSPDVGNESKALTTCPLVSKMFPALKPKASPPVMVQAAQNINTEGAAGNSFCFCGANI